ncbi:MAG: DUF983 domain-containing protein [Acidimicrobiales bacterium]|nr:DUF983 domain-containing protein [Acidimicrobiales bacterium]
MSTHGDDDDGPVVGWPRALPPYRTLWRGVRRRCPVCGQGRLFRRWWHLVDSCPRCSLRFERVEGHWIGAIGVNTIVSFGALLIAVVAGTIITYPEVPVAPVLLVCASVAFVVPLAFYPSSKTLWTAIDLLMRPLEPGEADPFARDG